MNDDVLQELLRKLELLPEIARRLEELRLALSSVTPRAPDAIASAAGAAPKPIWPEIDPLLAVHLTPEDVVFDIGANMGRHTQILANIGATTHAFEPNPRLAAKLREMFSSTPVTIHEIALSDTAGEASFHIDTRPEMPAVASSLLVLEDLHAAGKTMRITVKTDTIDAFVERTGACPTFLKLDVEGHEPAVLAGGKQTIEKHRPRIIFEMWGNHFPRFEATFDWLHPFYHLIRVSDGVDAYAFFKNEKDPKGCDILALPRPNRRLA